MSLQDILSKRIGDVEKPKTKPAGWYLISINGAILIESSKKKTPGVEITFDFVAPHESIDTALLEDVKVAGTQIRDTFYLTEGSLWRLFGDAKKGVDGFVQQCGLQPTAEDGLMEVIKMLPGAQVLAEISQEPTQSGDSTFNKVTKYRKV